MSRVAAAVALAGALACGSSPSGYEPCRGKLCGDPCTVCAPGDPSCYETAEIKSCDSRRQCLPSPQTSTCLACGGLQGTPCPSGMTCAYWPGCDPTKGGADCQGTCMQ